MKLLKIFFLITDIGFIIYWLITLFHFIPENLLFKDYNNPILVSWNWSFFPLDMAISITGLSGLFFYKRNKNIGNRLILISLVLTFCSGLQAISFWVISNDFDITWWIPNLYLLIYPVFFITMFLKQQDKNKL